MGDRSSRLSVYLPPWGQESIFPPRDRYGRTSSQVETSSGVLRLSSTHCCVAPSICRRLLMHEFQHGVFRARINVGTTAAVRAKANTTPTLMIDLLDMCVRALKPSSHHCRVNGGSWKSPFPGPRASFHRPFCYQVNCGNTADSVWLPRKGKM